MGGIVQDETERQCNRLGQFAMAALDFLLPGVCLLCAGRARLALCPACSGLCCAARLRCRVCANPLAAAAALCGPCLRAAPAFDASIAAGDYAEPLAGLVRQLKFQGRLLLAPWGGAQLAAASAGLDALPDLLCPVPLGPQRLRERGYNQALELARPLARALGRPLLPGLLLRVRETAAQSGLAPAQRARNVHGAFAVAKATMALVRGRHIGLVDDVMSSGHTLAAIAALLKRHGAGRVSNFVLARTPPH